MKVVVVLKEYDDKEDFKWKFIDVLNVNTYQDSIEIEFYDSNDEEYMDKRYDIKTKIEFPKKNIKEIIVYAI